MKHNLSSRCQSTVAVLMYSDAGRWMSTSKDNSLSGVLGHDLTSSATPSVIRSDCSVYVHICQAWAFDDGLKHILRYEIWSSEIGPAGWFLTPAGWWKRQEYFAHCEIILILTELCLAQHVLTTFRLLEKHQVSCICTFTVQLFICLYDEINARLWWYTVSISFCPNFSNSLVYKRKCIHKLICWSIIPCL